MKTKNLLLTGVMLMHTALTVVAQNATDKKFAPQNIPFGKKLPPPDLTKYQDNSFLQTVNPNPITSFLPGMNTSPTNSVKKDPAYFRRLLLERRKTLTSSPVINKAVDAKRESVNSITSTSDFHLTKDINALAESNPYNYHYRIDIYDNFSNDFSASYAVLDNVIYFDADDGIHGNELWRSDGTDAGTYMVKDIEPGAVSSYLNNITAANGKIYFVAYTSANGSGTWVSDGTERGTQLLTSVGEPTEFFAMREKVYFVADGADFWSALWETDGTAAGTKMAIDMGSRGSGGQQITQPTIINGLLFFTFLDYETLGWRIWRSDLTDAGTYHVSPSYPALDSTGSYLTNNTPAQLTNYKYKLYFSANDGTGRKLWVSDGTDAGTTLAPGNHNVLINADYLKTSFPILNNVLYVPGEKAIHGNGLYKYDASDAAGLVKIKDFAPDGDTAFIVPSEMQVIKHTLYFKVISYTGGIHDELWSSDGCRATRHIKIFLPQETINTLYNGCGTLFFIKSNDKVYGTELWKSNGTNAGTMLVSDIFKGATSSYPGNLTASNGKLFFTAANGVYGNEVFMTNGTDKGTALVKDINTVSTTSSYAGFNFYGYSSIAALGNDVLFNAYERVHGYELYKSDGTAKGTELLNDVIPGEAGGKVVSMLSKNNAVYFSTTPDNGGTNHFIYKSNGTKSGLTEIVSDNFFIRSFNVADNGLVFYTHYNSITGMYELWRSNGTASGTFLLSPTLNYTNCLNVVGNTAFFGAGDAINGYELWKSDGSVPGTKLVKDINPGVGNSSPVGMAIYKNEVYFAADNGSGPSFWKSDGTKSGTIQLRQIDPFYSSSSAFATEKYYFEVSNNILYFSAINYRNSKGTQLWRTNGTVSGTHPVKDISPNDTSLYPVPSYFTDVNGTLFFIGNDGEHGTELWKTDGTKEGTKLVKDIIPGIDGSNINHLTSFAGKLYFGNAEVKEDGVSRYYLWSSDGTSEGTNEVGGFGISHIAAIFPAKNKLFLDVYTSKYGNELYAGKADEKFVAVSQTNEAVAKTTDDFNVLLYPNPAASKATLQITGNVKNVSISITDMSGKKIWQSNANAMLMHLPTEKFAPGIYIVTVTNGKESKTIKLVKE